MIEGPIKTKSAGPLFEQLPTAGLPPATAKADPTSSRLAERKITKSGERQRQVLRIAWLVRHFPGSTSAELADTQAAKNAGLNRMQIARRMKDTVTAKLIRRGALRVCRVTRSQCVTWLPIEQGGKDEAETDA